MFNICKLLKALKDETYIDDSQNSQNLDDRLLVAKSDENADETMMFFKGWRADLDSTAYEKFYALFEGQNKITYRIPNTCLCSDLGKMEEAWEKVSERVLEDIEKYNVTTICGVSLGTVAAIYAANRADSVKKVALSLPADSITPVVWKGILTQQIVKEAEEKGVTMDDFYQSSKQFDPINNLDNLEGKDIRMFLAKRDKVVPYKNGQKLVEKMNEIGLKPKVRKMPFVGHYAGGRLSIEYLGWMKD